MVSLRQFWDRRSCHSTTIADTTCGPPSHPEPHPMGKVERVDLRVVTYRIGLGGAAASHGCEGRA